MPVSNAAVYVEPEWYETDDLPATKCRNVRGHSGMIIGRILFSARNTRYEAQVFNRGIWKTVGEFNEFDQAVAGVSEPLR